MSKQTGVYNVKESKVVTMFFEDLHKLGNKAFSTLKWAVTAVSGALTTGLILVLGN